jgi:predicted transcriptional regulator
MATTSLKLPDALKERVVKLAELAGKSPHAFMVDVIANETERAEKRQAFIQSAIEAKKNFDETGMGYDGDEVSAYFRAKILSNNPALLTPKKYK